MKDDKPQTGLNTLTLDTVTTLTVVYTIKLGVGLTEIGSIGNCL